MSYEITIELTFENVYLHADDDEGVLGLQGFLRWERQIDLPNLIVLGIRDQDPRVMPTVNELDRNGGGVGKTG